MESPVSVIRVIKMVSELVCSFRSIEIQNLLRWFAVTFASAGYTAIVIVSGFSLPDSYFCRDWSVYLLLFFL